MENKNAYEYWIYTPHLDEFVTNDSESAERAYAHFIDFAKNRPIDSNSVFVKQTRYGRLQKMYSGELARELTELEIESEIIRDKKCFEDFNRCIMGLRIAVSSMSKEDKEKMMNENWERA